jgi:hypothetical protein
MGVGMLNFQSYMVIASNGAKEFQEVVRFGVWLATTV